MIDPKFQFNKQHSEFLQDYKHRFQQFNYNGMPGRLAYTTKLNRMDVNSNLNLYGINKEGLYLKGFPWNLL